MEMAQQALGLIETRGMVALVEAADAALKAANVSYRGWKQVGSGLVTVVLEGDVAAVKAAVDAGAASAAKVGEVVSVDVIARPHGDIAKILPNK
jgi:ethanolamine utilization protein EutM